MGLRFRKSIRLCKGLKLNIGKTGFSISAGIPGFRKTIHSSGKVTTSIGIPGTGIYYVDTKNPTKKKASAPTNTRNQSQAYTWSPAPQPSARPDPKPEEPLRYTQSTAQGTHVVVQQCVSDGHVVCAMSDCTNETNITTTQPVLPITMHVGEVIHPIPDLKFPSTMVTELFEHCDYPVKWIDVISNAYPQEGAYNPETWEYLRSKAIAVFEGDIEAMLEVIEQVNPYDDLLDYLTDFEFEADDAECIEVTCRLLQNSLGENKEDAAASLIIRLARDTFALLPISSVRVRVLNAPESIISDVYFDREVFAETIFENQDPRGLLVTLSKTKETIR